MPRRGQDDGFRLSTGRPPNDDQAGLTAANAGKFTVTILAENYSFVPEQEATQKPCDLKGLLGTFTEGFWPGRPNPCQRDAIAAYAQQRQG
jgi:hypothetical protein